MVTLSSAAIWYGLPSYIRSAKAYSAGLISSIAVSCLHRCSSLPPRQPLLVSSPCCQWTSSWTRAAAFARVGDAPVDEHGVGGEAVYAVEFAGKPRAGHMQVWCNVVQCHAHLPVAHARRQWQRHRITHLLFWRTRIPRHPHVGDGVEVVGVSFDGFFIHLSSSLCSYHFVVVYKMMGGQCFQRFEPI